MINPVLSNHSILLIDDEEHALISISTILKAFGLEDIVECSDSTAVMDILSKQQFSLILLDLDMPEQSGFDLMPKIAAEYPETTIIILTAYDDPESVVTSMKLGAYDFLTKPADKTRLMTTIFRALESYENRNQIESLKNHLLSSKLKRSDCFIEIITANEKMYSIFRYIEAIGATNFPVLIEGETGVGKELIAGALHRVSGRRGDFVPVNVAGLDTHMFTDTLFGHRKGAYTGALTERRGLISQAAEGTLFLDEIGDLEPDAQIKLLRLIQENEYYPLGSDRTDICNARFVFATNKNMKSLMEKGKYRKDLYYRLKSHLLSIPPLRERKNDIPYLVEYFVKEVCVEMNMKKTEVGKDVLSILMNYHFPGNIRELKGIISEALVRSGGKKLKAEHLVPMESISAEKTDSTHFDILKNVFPLPTLNHMKNILIKEALKRNGNNQSKAAKDLGISRQTLSTYLNKMDSY